MVTMQCRPTSRHLRPSGSMSPDSGGALRRRSQKDGSTWARIEKLAHDFLPKPRILHPWPSERFAVKHPRWEPYAGKPHLRIWCSEADQTAESLEVKALWGRGDLVRSVKGGRATWQAVA